MRTIKYPCLFVILILLQVSILLRSSKRINKEYNDLIILRINTSKYVNLKKEFNINKIPTFILYIEDEIKARIDGYKDQYSLINWIKKNRS